MQSKKNSGSVWIGITAILLLWGAAPALMAGSVVKSDTASCQIIDDANRLFLSVLVASGNLGPPYVVFETQRYDPATNTEYGVLGYGFIPDEMISGSLNHLKLNIDTSLAPELSAYTWTDNGGFYPTYTPANGVVEVEWDQTTMFIERATGSSMAKFTYPDGSQVGFRFSGPWERQSAKAQGSVFGLQFVTQDAETSSSKENQIEFNKNPN